MIDSQPKASRPRKSRPLARRATVNRQHAQSPENDRLVKEPQAARWKVRLELEPAEIALVYRQGLAHGAEVRRDSLQEWRPLVTTKELRSALSKRESESERADAVPALMLTQTQTLAVRDPSLAALLLTYRPPAVLARRPSSVRATVPPPPPPVITVTRARETVARRTTSKRRDSIPDSAVTQPVLPRASLGAESEVTALTFSPAATSTPTHARSVELSLAGAVSMVATLLLMLVLQRATHWGEARAKMPENHALSNTSPSSATLLGAATPASTLGVTSGISIPVVPVHDLPIEQAGARALLGAAKPPVAVAGVDRGELASAMSRAAASAKHCGAGPVHAQVVATFGPSGVPRAVHFGALEPAPELRSCVLRALSRARVAPFSGEAVTVSKNLSW